MSNICNECNKRIWFWSLNQEGYHSKCIERKLKNQSYEVLINGREGKISLSEASNILEELSKKRLRVSRRGWRTTTKVLARLCLILAIPFIAWTGRSLYVDLFKLFHEPFSYSSLALNSLSSLLHIGVITLWVWNIKHSIIQLKKIKKDKMDELFEELSR